jgi:hypothetical protein
LSDLIEILGRLVEANRAVGRSETFVLAYTASGPEIIGHGGWREDAQTPSDAEVDDLAEQGWVRITDIQGKGRKFAVTAAGREAWDEHLRLVAPATSTRVVLDWAGARPVLRQIFEAYQDAGAPEKGVDALAIAERSDERLATEARIRELVRSGLLDVVFGSAAGPRLVRPSPTALQMLAGWPSGPAQDALDGLVQALDSEIEHTGDEDKRSALERVRSGLIGAARDVALAYFEKKVMGF